MALPSSRMPASAVRTLQERFAELKQAYRNTDPAAPPSGEFIIELMHLLFTYGVQAKASDLHVEPIADGARIRYRIDGVLHELLMLPAGIRDPLIRAIKTKADLATEVVGRSRPQDGRINVPIEERLVDMRLSSFPTLFGDVLALRIMSRAAMRLRLEELGFHPEVLSDFFKAINRPNGLVLVTGPTNSGKTTTLYAALEHLQSPYIKIVTLEDPVEQQLAGVDQAQINPQIGFTFASGLRTILRQDSNVILVGEIRDKETAEIAIRAALTGHLVLSTLHTRDACGAVTRLIEMGLEPYLIVAALTGVLAIRLVRLVCRDCAQPDSNAEPAYARLLGKLQASEEARKRPGATFMRGAGCPHCNGSGYRGRTAVFEFLRLPDELKDKVLRGSTRDLFKAAVASGMRTMVQDGLEKAAQGLTTIEEILRVVGDTEAG
ncbi:MAG TPA: GspE/PulE family protein [bacterium]